MCDGYVLVLFSVISTDPHIVLVIFFCILFRIYRNASDKKAWNSSTAQCVMVTFLFCFQSLAQTHTEQCVAGVPSNKSESFPMPPKATTKRKLPSSQSSSSSSNKIPKKADKGSTALVKADAGHVRRDSPGAGLRAEDEIESMSALKKHYLVTQFQAIGYYKASGHSEESYNYASQLAKQQGIAGGEDDAGGQRLGVRSTRSGTQEEEKAALAAVAQIEAKSKSPNKPAGKGSKNRGKGEIEDHDAEAGSRTTASSSSSSSGSADMKSSEAQGAHLGTALEVYGPERTEDFIPFATWWRTTQTTLPTAVHFPNPTGMPLIKDQQTLTLKGVHEMGLIRPVSTTQIDKVADAFADNDNKFDPSHPVRNNINGMFCFCDYFLLMFC
jgi:hypothetical protein